jgi:hypothetical protein
MQPTRWQKVLAWLDSVSRELMLFLGLIILAIGLWSVYRAAAFIVPGAILVAVAVFGVATIGERPPR